jgi:NAD+ kinase
MSRCTPAGDKPVLLIAKKSFFEVYGLEKRDAHFLTLMRSDSDLSRRLKSAHDENRKAIDKVREHLQRQGVVHVVSDVMSRQLGDGASLVVSVGGDGTLLMASHGVYEVPVLGINSRPGHSVGHFCGADMHSFPAVLDGVLSGTHDLSELTRMDLFVNDEMKLPPVLNDALYCAVSPGSSTLYSLDFPNRSEVQKSSGIWFSTPAGSTAGIQSAGGYPMQLDDRQIQFRVRELYRSRSTGPSSVAGTFTEGVRVQNLTPEAAVFLDGSRIQLEVRYGDTVQPRVSDYPLRIFL